MFIAEPRDRRPSNSEDVTEHRATRLDRERREFIRTAAVRITVTIFPDGSMVSPGRAWEIAAALWAMKPEDL